jgi:hypothetical protein
MTLCVASQRLFMIVVISLSAQSGNVLIHSRIDLHKILHTMKGYFVYGMIELSYRDKFFIFSFLISFSCSSYFPLLHIVY